MLVLLPPSEGKAAGGRGRWSFDAGGFGVLADRRRQVAEAVVAAAAADAGRVFGATGPLSERAAAAAAAVVAGTAPALPAWRRFHGVVWEHLDPGSLPAPLRRRIVVPTALLGLCRGDDPVPDFRLKFGVVLPGIGRLDRWWRDELTAALARTRGPVVDLLPNEHAAALDRSRLGRREVVRVGFTAADGRAAAGHAAKAVKGVVARTVLLEGPDALHGFRWSGWSATPTDGGWAVRSP